MPNRGGFTQLAVAMAGLVLAAGCAASGGSSGEFKALPQVTQAAGGLGQSASPEPSESAGAGSPGAPGTAASPGGPAGDPLPIRSTAPAAAAGGICTKLDFAGVKKAIGTEFAVAAATGTPGREQVCVLQQSGGDSDLTLSTAPTTIDAESFKLDYQPSTGKALAGLGLAAYSQLAPGGAGAGPSAEVGWLTKNALVTLTYGTPPGTSPSAASAALPGLIQLAHATAAR